MKHTRFAFVIFLILHSGLNSCKTVEDSKNKNLFGGLFGNSQKNYITLKSGKRINVNTYKIDATVEQEVMSWLESEKTFQRAPTGPQHIYLKGEAPILLGKHETILSPAEVSGLVFYSNQGYQAFTAYWNGEEYKRNEDSAPITKKQIESIFLATVSALNQLPKNNETVFFGAPLSLNDWKGLLEPGKIFKQNNFTSTSTKQSIASDFANDFYQSSDESQTVFPYIFSVKANCGGSRIGRYSTYIGEEEILFPPNHEFKVISNSYDEEKKSYNIELEDMSSCKDKNTEKFMIPKVCRYTDESIAFSNSKGDVIARLPEEGMLVVSSINDRLMGYVPVSLDIDHIKCSKDYCGVAEIDLQNEDKEWVNAVLEIEEKKIPIEIARDFPLVPNIYHEDEKLNFVVYGFLEEMPNCQTIQ